MDCDLPSQIQVQAPDSAALAALPALPCLIKDNSSNTLPRKGRNRQTFVARENIEKFIQFEGQDRVGVLTCTVADDSVSFVEYQRRWNSFLAHVLKPLFPAGVWIREIQDGTGNPHSHAVVRVGFDIRSQFPWADVRNRRYSKVDKRLRRIWKTLRESAPNYGFGRIELLPIKADGQATAQYLTKYLSKAMGSETPEGQEKRRLFGMWGSPRYCNARFSFVSSRDFQRKKQWFRDMLGYDDLRQLSPHWYFHFGDALREVLMPECWYTSQAGRKAQDGAAIAYIRASNRWSHHLPDSKIQQSQFLLFVRVGAFIYGERSPRASQFAFAVLGVQGETAGVSRVVIRADASAIPSPQFAFQAA